ncbi:MAG: type IV pilus secretin PilQ [Alteromonadaceae bacterium]|nr:MAG: type IV pilus secretin PilQ [Alteromonadaceae bacterium]
MFRFKLIISLTLALFSISAEWVNAVTLEDISFLELPGNRAEIRLVFDGTPTVPKGYTIEQPARIVLDFDGVTNGLAQMKYAMGVGDVSSAVVVAGGGRTRLILNLDRLVAYRSVVNGSEFVVEIGAEARGVVSAVDENGVVSSELQSASRISDVDFRRGDVGEGKVIISLTNSAVNVDVEEVSGGIKITFLDTELPVELRRKLDVVDFATPVSLLASVAEGGNSVVTVSASGDYDYLAYQTDNEYVLSVKPLSEQELVEKKKKFAYVGDRFSFNFQDIAVRSALQLLADFTDMNLVASDTVTGSITLRLENVPWDQALDIILKAKGLDKRLEGNVLMVAPAVEIAERERQQIETAKQLQELAPLRTEYIRIRYANARELFSLFAESSGGGGGGGAESGNGSTTTGSILSERGTAIVDERTNSIILTDTEEKINGFKRLVDQIDVPVRQVMIEARIVRANTDFRKELGVRISGDAVETSNNGRGNIFEFTGRMDGLVANNGGVASLFRNDGTGVSVGERDLVNSSLVDLGVFDPAGAFTWNIIGSNFLLGMELSALQDTGFAEIVSQPKVITQDKKKASIESGTEVPFQEESASGGTTTSFKEAVLKLDVTPQITPDNRIIMDLHISQDAISSIDAASGIPIIDITQLKTQVLVSDGETIVLGGIYSTDSVDGVTKVPLLGDIPFIGRLFRKTTHSETKRELLIFITPKIMASDLID